MSQVGFEPTISVFVRAKTVHDLDSAATVVGIMLYISVHRPPLWSSGQGSWLQNGDVLFPVRYELIYVCHVG
jgi:hypothetical protein